MLYKNVYYFYIIDVLMLKIIIKIIMEIQILICSLLFVIVNKVLEKKIVVVLGVLNEEFEVKNILSKLN